MVDSWLGVRIPDWHFTLSLLPTRTRGSLGSLPFLLRHISLPCPLAKKSARFLATPFGLAFSLRLLVCTRVHCFVTRPSINIDASPSKVYSALGLIHLQRPASGHPTFPIPNIRCTSPLVTGGEGHPACQRGRQRGTYSAYGRSTAIVFFPPGLGV